ncbi:MAG: lipopolysaccharide biosynthesis protein RfbH [Nitrospinota bacterium]|nr:lipopolysaccharide biosynthesis protein RfbH [Nitrospinota bacterium]
MRKKPIFDLVKRYYEENHARPKFVPGKTLIHYAGRHYDAGEMVNLVDSALEFRLTAGRFAERMERALADFFGAEEALLVNSGSSANLLMVATACQSGEADALRPGDEILTPAATFPTTLAPILQNGLVPVLLDVEPGTYNINPDLIEPAATPRTRGLLVPHTLGNPCDMDRLVELCAKHGWVLLEDCCDALGSEFNGKRVGTFGAMASLSFYPAHHITMGEGGAVVLNDERLSRPANSIRDWGRDCWCIPGVSNTCGKRFGWEFEDLPGGYDHKYVFSRIGYNLKVTDMQAAVGLAQLAKAGDFIERRRRNFRRLYEGLRGLTEYLVLPEWSPKANPSWFAFPLTLREGLERGPLIAFLEGRKIETRLLFAGNAARQPAFRGEPIRVPFPLEVSDAVLERSFFVGVFPGLTDPMLDYMIESIHDHFTDPPVRSAGGRSG